MMMTTTDIGKINHFVDTSHGKLVIFQGYVSLPENCHTFLGNPQPKPLICYWNPGWGRANMQFQGYNLEKTSSINVAKTTGKRIKTQIHFDPGSRMRFFFLLESSNHGIHCLVLIIRPL